MAAITISPKISQNIVKNANGSLTVIGASGNARGINAIDLQQSNNGTTQVASGDNSVILGGTNNTASGSYSTASGYNCTASGAYSSASGYGSIASNDYSIARGITSTASGYSSIAFGFNNTSSSFYSIAIGGNNTSSGHISIVIGNSSVASADNAITFGLNCTASGKRSFACGTGCTASAYYSIATGEQSRANKWDMKAHSGGAFATIGDAQISTLVCRIITGTDGASYPLFLDGNHRTITIPANEIFSCMINISATTGTDAAQFLRQLIIKNVAGTTSIIGSVATIGVDIKSSGAALWDIAITADDTGDFLQISGTGGVGNTSAIRFVAEVNAVEIGF